MRALASPLPAPSNVGSRETKALEEAVPMELFTSLWKVEVMPIRRSANLNGHVKVSFLSLFKLLIIMTSSADSFVFLVKISSKLSHMSEKKSLNFAASTLNLDLNY